MYCSACGPKEYDLLFKCNNCGNDFCQGHVQSHQCIPQQVPMQRIMEMFSQNYSMREPTDADYEMQLRASPQILTTGRESLDLFLATFLLFLVFGLRPLLTDISALRSVMILTIAIAPAFILHELAHKYSAIKFGKYARFALIKQMTYFTLIVAFLGFGIAGPGATMIMGRSTKREQGIFAASGPALNAALSLLSYILLIYIGPLGYVTLNEILSLSIFVNSFLGLFNLIPISLLDGKKVMKWNSGVWLALVLANLLGFMIAS